MIITSTAQCPYCGVTNRVRFEAQEQYTTDRRVVFCDVEIGGCDTMFVVASTLTVKSDVFAIVDAAPETAKTTESGEDDYNYVYSDFAYDMDREDRSFRH